MSIFSEFFNLSGREEEIDAVIAVVTLIPGAAASDSWGIPKRAGF